MYAVDRIARWMRDAADIHAADPLEHQRRMLNGLRIKAQLYAAKTAKPSNVLRLRKVAR